jgi:hypothetical protein
MTQGDDNIACVQALSAGSSNRVAGVADQPLKKDVDGVIAISGMVTLHLHARCDKLVLHDRVTLSHINAWTADPDTKERDRVVGTFVRHAEPRYCPTKSTTLFAVRIMLCPWLYSRPIDDMLEDIRNQITIRCTSWTQSAEDRPSTWNDAAKKLHELVDAYNKTAV